MFSSMVKRQIAAITALPSVFGGIFKFLLHLNFKRVGALIVAFFHLIGAAVFDTPVKPYGESIDMSRLSLYGRTNLTTALMTQYGRVILSTATMILSFVTRHGGTAHR